MLSDSLIRPVLSFLLRLCFRVEVRGVEHYHAAGDKVLIVANHQSFLDPLLLAVFMPEKPAFAINVFQAEKWFLRWLDRIITLYRLDPSKPLSMKRIMGDLKKGAKVVIFPEGRITTTGGIMRVYDGTGRIVEKTGATLLPVRVDGAEYSKLSLIGGKVRQRWFPTIRLTFMPPVACTEDEAVSARRIYDMLTESAFAAAPIHRPLLASILEARALHGAGHRVASDITRQWMSYRQLFTRAFILSDKLDSPQGGVERQERFIGVLLPNSLGAVVTFAALHMLGKIPCMLNFSAGPANILHACRIATVKTVLTSRVFVEKGKLEPVIEALQAQHRIVYLEDIKPSVTLKDKLRGLWLGLRPAHALKERLAQTGSHEPAVVLYTSGSEGTPKGVALSHVNVLANIEQACSRLDLMPSDRVFNALPVFHSFGLTVGMVLPLVRGVQTFLYPSPLHFRVIPELVYDTDSTIMLGTDTFFNGYARYAHPYDFHSVRLAVAGAEKLKESTRALYLERFGLRIFEGYGVTEASPAIAFNTPIECKPGTVGRPFPRIECRLEPVEGLEQGGRLFVRGPNVMLGYLKADQPGVIQPQGEWYDTGDIVAIDEEGFIAIQGRAKRFAKIGGEMVSLLAMEELAAELYPDATHAAIALPDDKKGEQVWLFSEAQALTRDALHRHAKTRGIAEIFLPRQVVPMEAIPRLGNGKIDYVTLGKEAQQHKHG